MILLNYSMNRSFRRTKSQDRDNQPDFNNQVKFDYQATRECAEGFLFLQLPTRRRGYDARFPCLRYFTLSRKHSGPKRVCYVWKLVHWHWHQTISEITLKGM